MEYEATSIKGSLISIWLLLKKRVCRRPSESFLAFPCSHTASYSREAFPLFFYLRKPFVTTTSKLIPASALGHRGPGSCRERHRWLPHNPAHSPSRSCLQNRTWGLFGLWFISEITTVLQATRGNAQLCGLWLWDETTEPVESRWTSKCQPRGFRHTDAPWTSCLPELQIQTSQMHLSS